MTVLVSSFIIGVIAPLWPAKLKPGKQSDLRLMFTKISLLIPNGFEALQEFSTAHIVILHIIFVTFLCFELCPFSAQILSKCIDSNLIEGIFEFLPPFCLGFKMHILFHHNPSFNPVVLRMGKTRWSFGHSECNRVNFCHSFVCLNLVIFGVQVRSKCIDGMYFGCSTSAAVFGKSVWNFADRCAYFSS